MSLIGSQPQKQVFYSPQHDVLKKTFSATAVPEDQSTHTFSSEVETECIPALHEVFF